MPISVRKDEDGIKFYGHQSEPIIIIYNDTKVAMLRDVILDDIRFATQVSEAIMIATIFIKSLNAQASDYKKNSIEMMYFNEADFSTEEKLYSPRKVLRWIESDKIVTVNKKERIKYQFTKFDYQNDQLIILYKPVVW